MSSPADRRTVLIELARQAWDYFEAAKAAQGVLSERDEYQLGTPYSVAMLLASSIELALKAYLLAKGASSTDIAGRGLESCLDEAAGLGLSHLIRIDSYDARLLSALDEIRSVPFSQSVLRQSGQVPPFDSLRKLCDRLLEIASMEAGYERTEY